MSYFDGLKKLANEKGINVTLVDLYDHMEDVLYTAAGSNEHGLKAEFYNNENLSGTPVTTRVDSRINFEWTSGPDAANVEKTISQSNGPVKFVPKKHRTILSS